ncbi:MAG TPA: zinc-binding dehydrogenase, partial [Gaiellaceae bacterium]|nr:zinc-binding dehydrogenase [Gaiellaceae bacterium]
AGVGVVVEVAPGMNADLDAAVLAPNGTVAVYAADGGAELPVSWPLMQNNVAYRFVLVYTVPAAAKDAAVADVSAAVADGALPVGEEAGLPLHRFPLEQASDAHAAVEAGAVGKVLIDLS